jgi:hypothetical protein
MACEKLWHTNSPLAFSVADIAQYPALQGEAEDKDHSGMLASPCKGVLPAEALARAPVPK